MANISKEKIFLKTVGEWMKVITYSKGKFRINLPDIIISDLVLPENDHQLSANSEIEVNRLFTLKLREWESAQTDNQRVIIFKAKFQGGLLREEKIKQINDGKYKPHYKWPGYGGGDDFHYFCEQEIDWAHDSSSLGLLINWGVYSKKTFKEKSKYTCISGRPFDRVEWDGKLTDGLTEIEWTEERETFFLELDESFAKMIAKIYASLGNLSPDKLIFLVENKTKMLPSSK